MAIRVRPTGLTELYGKLGKLAGKAQQARREEERISTIHRQLVAQQHAIEMRAFEAQLDIEAEKRARQWQLEKMEISSRADFMREEQRRLKRLDEKQARLDALEQAVKDGVIDSDDYNTAVLQEVTDIPFYTQGQIAGRAAARPTTARVPTESQYAYLSSQGYSDEEIRGMFNLTAPGTVSGVPTETTPIYQRNPTTGQVRVSHDGGKTWQILG